VPDPPSERGREVRKRGPGFDRSRLPALTPKAEQTSTKERPKRNNHSGPPTKGVEIKLRKIVKKEQQGRA